MEPRLKSIGSLSLELGWVKDGVSDQPDLGEIPWAVLDDVWRPEFVEPEADGELRAIVILKNI